MEIAKPALLTTLVDTVVAERPCASYHAGKGARMRLSQIRKRGRVRAL